MNLNNYRIILLLIVSALTNNVLAQSFDTIHINRGNLLLIDSNTVESISFNKENQYSSYNKVLEAEIGDTLYLTIINNDSIQHNLSIDTLSFSRNVAPSVIITDTLILNAFGVYPYYDSIGNNRYLGNCGILNVRSDQTSNKQHFYWNLHEIDTLFNQNIVAGNSVNWGNYSPQYFTINGNSKPHIDADSTAKIVGNVLDTIYVSVLSSGASLHSIHFHGYHLKVIQDNKGKLKDWEKDTFPIESMQSMLWMLVPDKPGEYPVHDHNLTAVAGGGYYPNGMFLMIDIE